MRQFVTIFSEVLETCGTLRGLSLLCSEHQTLIWKIFVLLGKQQRESFSSSGQSG